MKWLRSLKDRASLGDARGLQEARVSMALRMLGSLRDTPDDHVVQLKEQGVDLAICDSRQVLFLDNAALAVLIELFGRTEASQWNWSSLVRRTAESGGQLAGVDLVEGELVVRAV